LNAPILEASVNVAAISALFRQVDREVWLVTAQAGAHRGGLIATCVAQASIAPELPRVLVGLSRQHYTWELVEASGAFGLHLLADNQIEWVWRFGVQSGRAQDKFAGLRVQQSPAGSPILSDALGWLDCRVEAKLESGDRTLYLAEVLDGSLAGSRAPLSIKRLIELAPRDKLQQMDECRNRDAVLDAPLIRAWRAQHARH
jgi:flavin reductase (DIM6/NTAB) family NADH-FMN oxidoreductase RutF